MHKIIMSAIHFYPVCHGCTYQNCILLSVFCMGVNLPKTPLGLSIKYITLGGSGGGRVSGSALQSVTWGVGVIWQIVA